MLRGSDLCAGPGLPGRWLNDGIEAARTAEVTKGAVVTTVEASALSETCSASGKLMS